MSKISRLESWKGFLPQGAWVMAHRLAPSATTEETWTSEIPSPSTHHELHLSSQTLTINPDSGLTQNLSSEQILSVAPSTIPQSQEESLIQLQSELQNCQRCKLSCGRTHIVFGEGNPRARLVFVGEGPGEQEDLQGRPFVGKAGQLLDRMIAALGLSKNEVYILNIVKCRPPGNRNPEMDEITACSPFLYKQLELIQPQVIVALGMFAAQTLLQSEEKITQLRGRFHLFSGIKLMPTYHPAYLLKNPASKKEAWWDLQEVAKELGLTLPSRK
ncbi:uracil-DNA glycosylase [bacterium]|jgi:uracil-DNA glycosylase family 4|nr:uracil-DNA glycosylase [bacterium]